MKKNYFATLTIMKAREVFSLHQLIEQTNPDYDQCSIIDNVIIIYADSDSCNYNQNMDYCILQQPFSVTEEQSIFKVYTKSKEIPFNHVVLEGHDLLINKWTGECRYNGPVTEDDSNKSLFFYCATLNPNLRENINMKN